MPDEAQLIEKAQAGDQEALSALVSKCWQPLFRFISYKTGSPEDAQEITQETFFRAFRSLSSFQKSDTKFATYLGRIASNLITDLWRKKGRSPQVSDISDHQNHLMDGSDPSEEAISHEQRELIASALKELSAEQRQVIELRIIAGLPLKETATAMDKTEAAIKMLQQRALKNLRNLLLVRGVMESE